MEGNWILLGFVVIAIYWAVNRWGKKIDLRESERAQKSRQSHYLYKKQEREESIQKLRLLEDAIFKDLVFFDLKPPKPLPENPSDDDLSEAWSTLLLVNKRLDFRKNVMLSASKFNKELSKKTIHEKHKAIDSNIHAYTHLKVPTLPSAP